MKTKYLLSALIAGAFGTGAALAQTSTYGTSPSDDGAATRGEVRSDARHDMRTNGASTGDGYTRQQLREAGSGGNADDYLNYLPSEDMRENETSGINAGSVSIGDGTAQP